MKVKARAIEFIIAAEKGHRSAESSRVRKRARVCTNHLFTDVQ
jgi:hypothetical protein